MPLKGEPSLAAHQAYIEELQAARKRLEDLIPSLATKSDVAEIKADIRDVLRPALDSAPPWAVRRISWLERIAGASVAAFFVAAWGTISKHVGGV